MLDASEIKRLIDNDIASEKKRFAAVGQRYYEGDHDIKQYRMFYYNADGELVEDRTRSNERISHPFFTELVDQLVSYILSSPENPIKSDAEGLEDHLNLYFDEDFWSEISDLLTGAYTKGFEYLYAYKNSAGTLTFECADSMGVVEVREKDTDDGCKYIIYWYIDRIEKGKKTIKRIQVHTERETNSFDGLDKFLVGQSTEFNTSAAIDLSTMAKLKENADVFYEALLKLINTTNADAIMVNGDMKTKIQTVARILGYKTESEEAFGRTITTIGEGKVRIIDLKNVVAVSSNTATETPIIGLKSRTISGDTATTGLTDIYAVHFSILDGFHGVTLTGSNAISQYLPDFNTPGAVKEGEVEMVACVALKNVKSAGVLRNIKIA